MNVDTVALEHAIADLQIAFDWDKTTSGFNYWKDVSDNMNAILAEAIEPARPEYDVLVKALRSIASNSCCHKCQEAALVARAALAQAKA